MLSSHQLLRIRPGRSGWPQELWDQALKRLEATAEALLMTDQELVDMSATYQTRQNYLGPTSGSIMIEIARRSTLSGHQRIAEVAERARLREC